MFSTAIYLSCVKMWYCVVMGPYWSWSRKQSYDYNSLVLLKDQKYCFSLSLSTFISCLFCKFLCLSILISRFCCLETTPVLPLNEVDIYLLESTLRPWVTKSQQSSSYNHIISQLQLTISVKPFRTSSEKWNCRKEQFFIFNLINISSFVFEFREV